jgi:hypothetical protein
MMIGPPDPDVDFVPTHIVHVMALPFTVTLFVPLVSGEHDPLTAGSIVGVLPPAPPPLLETPLLEPLLAWLPELPELPPLVPELLLRGSEPLLPDPPLEPELLSDPLEPPDPPEPPEPEAPELEGDPPPPLPEGSPKPPDVGAPPQAAKIPIATSPSSRRIARLLRATNPGRAPGPE